MSDFHVGNCDAVAFSLSIQINLLTGVIMMAQNSYSAWSDYHKRWYSSRVRKATSKSEEMDGTGVSAKSSPAWRIELHIN